MHKEAELKEGLILFSNLDKELPEKVLAKPKPLLKTNYYYKRRVTLKTVEGPKKKPR